MHHKSVWASSVGDGHHCAVAHCGRVHHRREAILTVLTVSTIGAVRAIGTGRAGRTRRALRSRSTVMHHEGERRIVRKVDGIGIIQATRHRARDALDTPAIGTIGTGRTRRALRTLLAIANHIALRGAVGHCAIQHIARIRGRHHKCRHIPRIGRIQRVRHAQQLLHALHRVVDAAIRVNLGFEVKHPLSPRNLAEIMVGVSAAHLHGQQAVVIGGDVVRLHIDGRSRGSALQDGESHRDVLVRHQGIVAAADHRLIRHFLGCLRHYQDAHQHHHTKGK